MINKTTIQGWIARIKPPKYVEYEEKENKWSTSKKKIKKRYYLCDFCKKGIEIKDKIEEQDGGEFDLPFIRTGIGKARIAVHNKCLNNLLHEVDEWYKKKNEM